MTFPEGNRPTQDREAVLEEVGRVLPDSEQFSGLFSNRELLVLFGTRLGDVVKQLEHVCGVYPEETRVALSITASNRLSEAVERQNDLQRKASHTHDYYQSLDQIERRIVDVLAGSISRPSDERQELKIGSPFYDQVVRAVAGEDREMLNSLRINMHRNDELGPLAFKRQLGDALVKIQRDKLMRLVGDFASRKERRRFERILHNPDSLKFLADLAGKSPATSEVRPDRV